MGAWTCLDAGGRPGQTPQSLGAGCLISGTAGWARLVCLLCVPGSIQQGKGAVTCFSGQRSSMNPKAAKWFMWLYPFLFFLFFFLFLSFFLLKPSPEYELLLTPTSQSEVSSALLSSSQGKAFMRHAILHKTYQPGCQRQEREQI